jgi:hypothetical protein
MPKIPGLFQKRVDQGLTQEQAEESLRKTQHLDQFWKKQKTTAGKINALTLMHQLRYCMRYDDDVDSQEVDKAAKKYGYLNSNPTLRERCYIYDAEDELIADAPNDLDGLTDYMKTIGFLMAQAAVEAGKDRAKILEMFPNDPDRDLKADMILHTSRYSSVEKVGILGDFLDGVLSKEGTNLNSLIKTELEKKTGKSLETVTLSEFAALMNIPEEESAEFYAQFSTAGQEAKPEDLLTERALGAYENFFPEGSRREDAERQIIIAQVLNRCFKKTMEKQGMESALALMPEKEKRFFDDGYRYSSIEVMTRHRLKLYKDKPKEDLEKWIKENDSVYIRHELRAGNIRKKYIGLHDTINKQVTPDYLFHYPVPFEKLSGMRLPGDVKQSLIHDQCLRYEERMKKRQSSERRMEAIDHYILGKYLESRFENGADKDVFSAEKLENLRDVIRSEITCKLPKELLKEADPGKYLSANMDKLLSGMAKLDRKADDRNRVGYLPYLRKHTGENAGNTAEEKVRNLSKAMAAEALRRIGSPFSLKTIHKFAEHCRKTYAMDELLDKPERLDSFLKDPGSIRAAGIELRKDQYGIAPERMDDYSSAMGRLMNSMVDPGRHSKAYKALFDCVKEIAGLGRQAGDLSADKKAQKYINANMKLTEALRKYTKGREKLMKDKEREACFHNALDAMALMKQFAPGSGTHVDRIVKDVNLVRNMGLKAAANYIDPDTLTEKYGADRAESAKLSLSQSNKKIRFADHGNREASVHVPPHVL